MANPVAQVLDDLEEDTPSYPVPPDRVAAMNAASVRTGGPGVVQGPAPGGTVTPPAPAAAAVDAANPFASNPMLAMIYKQMQEQAAARQASQKPILDMYQKQIDAYGQKGMSDIDKASLLFQAAGALAAPTRSGALMESIGAAGTAVSGPLAKAAQAERDRQDKVAQLQMARAKIAAEMSGTGGVSPSDMLQLYKAQLDMQPKPGETERLLQTLPPEQRQEAVRSRFGLEKAGELKEFKLPDGTSMSVIMKDGKPHDPLTMQPLSLEAVTARTTNTPEARRAEATASGIPTPERDILRNLPPKKREEMRSKLIADGTKLLDKIETEAPTSSLETDIADTKRFLELNAENQGKTGPIVGMTPSLSEAAKEMDRIGATMSRKMRQPGEGATSDYDARMFQKMTLGTGNQYAVNRNAGLAMIAQRKTEIERREFMREYLSQNGTLDGAQKSWSQYLKDNPIFAPGQEKADMRNLRLNNKRAEWRDYFREKMEGGSQPRGAFVRGPNGELVPAGGQ